MLLAIPRKSSRALYESLHDSDLVLALALFILTLLSRIPFRAAYLYSWDSVLYTRAIQHFDVSVHQPQPPGYIFYVGLVWMIDRLLGDPNTAMVWISILASAAAVAALFLLGRSMFDRRTGLLAALLLATGTSFWGLSEVAFPYTVLAFLSILTATMVYKVWQGRRGFILSAALTLGLAAGFRQDLLPFLLPLFLAALLRCGRRRALPALAVLAAAVAAWYVPSSLLTGGWAVYRQASSQETAGVMHDFSVFYNGLPAFSRNGALLWRYLMLALAGALPFAAYLILLRVRQALNRAWHRHPAARQRLRQGQDGLQRQQGPRRMWFLSLWFLPAALFYLLVHIGEAGYVFLILPPALLAAGRGASLLAGELARRLPSGAARVAAVALPAAAIALNLLLFLGSSVSYGSRDLASRDEVFASRLSALQDNFDPDDTLIVAVYEFERVLYYLPGYRVWHFDPVTDEVASTAIPDDVENIVFFGDELELGGTSLVEKLPVSDGKKLVYIDRDSIGSDKHVLAVDWTSKRVAFT